MPCMSRAQNDKFWKTVPMAEMSRSQWESLCDGCGKCCCIRLEDEDTQDVYITDVACHLFDPETCQCSDYANRSKKVPDCVTLSPDNVEALYWMPQTCSYRLVANGEDLPDWHHLVTGSKDSIHDAGMSVQYAVQNEKDVDQDELHRHIVIWPGEPDME